VPQAVKDAIANATRKFKVKVDGEELEIDEAQLLSDYQTNRAAQQRFQAAAKLHKQAEEVIQLLKTNPRAALRHPAIQANERALAEAIFAEELENDLLDPKDREIRQLKKQWAEREAQEQRAKQDAQQQAMVAAEQQYVESYQKDISSALTTAGLPITNATVRSMTGYLQNALEAGYDMQPAQVVTVKQDTKSSKELFSASDAQTIALLLGERAES
jgi:glutamine synthetase